MKKSLSLLSLSMLLMLGCQPQTNTQGNTTASDTVSTVSQPATSTTPSRQEQQRQAEVMAKDTLNAVQEEVVKKTSNASFETFFQNFMNIIQRQDAAGFNQLIDAQRGLYTIETTGTMPNFYHIKDISKHRLSNFNKPFFSIREEIKSCNLKEVKTLPKVNCQGDSDMYTQKGCFVADGSEFQEARIHQFASLPEAENERIDKTLPLISKSVLHTGSGYKFYFGQVNGQWKVLFINLMAPCSA
ncbi:hypothetical protein [Rufibacter roseus]|uniref:Lipoprotein n=1 Tax=Rufibacter roseus TaxID=1567108 RepID=A0ABW2DHY9_9BACT|nr:hypothetical protein [Rufibacter roseus]